MTAEYHSILLAEDNPKDVELTLAALETHNLANDVVVVEDGAEALDYLYCRGKYRMRPNGNPAVVLLDLKMPKVNGIEVLQTIRTEESLKKIPVVILTSSREESDIVKSYELGISSYVVKPVNFQEFADTVGKLGVYWVLINEPPPGSVRRAR